MSRIEGQVAFVTGANRGIGRAFVEELLAAGAAKIYAAARNPETLADLVASGNGRVVPVEIDVTKPDMIERAAAAHRDVSVLINNAGIATFEGLIAARDGAPARNEMETNYFGTLNMIRSFAPVLAANGGGAIVNLSSIAGQGIRRDRCSFMGRYGTRKGKATYRREKKSSSKMWKVSNSR